MRIEDRECRLKDGRRAVLRNARESDAEAMLELLRVTAGETDYLLRTPEEWGRFTLEGERAHIAQTNGSDTELMLVCETDGRLAGCASLMMNRRVKTRHRAEVAISNLRAFWGQGIGTELLRALIGAARKNPDVRQVELEVVEGNDRARALYEKLGFRLAGIHPNAMRMRDGSLRALYLMILEI